MLYNGRHGLHSVTSCGENSNAADECIRTKRKIMGDKSPKSTQKKSTQKQSKASSPSLKKKQAVAVKQSANKKK